MQEVTQFRAKQNNLSLSVLEKKIDLRHLFYTLWGEKWIIFAFMGVAFVMGLMAAINKVPTYKANVLLQVEKSQPSFGALNPLGALNKPSSQADVQIALIKSRFILIPAVKKLGLDVDIKPHYLPVLGAWYARNHSSNLQSPVLGMKQYAWGGEELKIQDFQISDNYIGERFTLVAEANDHYRIYTAAGKLILRGKVGQAAQINFGNHNFSILITKLTANPGTEFYFSKLSTESLADNFANQLSIVDLGQVYKGDKTGVLQVYLSGPNPNIVVDLLNTIAETTVIKDMERKSLEAEKTLLFLNEQLPQIKKSLNVTEDKLNKHKHQSGTMDLTLKTRMIIKQLADVQKELEKANLTRIILLQQLTPAHPAIITLEGKKQALEEEMLSLEKELQMLPTTDQISIGLLRDIKVKTQLYLMLLNKIQELKVIKASTTSDVRILNPATIPNSALPLGRGVAIFTSLLLGMILGCLFVFFRKIFASYVEDPNWLEEHFGIPTFAIIPYSNEQKLNMQSFKDKSYKHLPLLAKTNPRDLSIEALRSLRTSLQFAMLNSKNNIISIMGISPSIGKSFVSVNFSHVLADTGKRVLLIDGDIRKGYLHDYFDKKRSPGLCEAILGEISLNEAIQKTDLEQLDFLPTGKFPFNPSELLMSEKFKGILSQASAQYDLVLIDTAPVLAVTDGSIIGNLSGVNFLLVSWGKHRAEEIELTMKRLNSNGVKIQGVIVNSTQARTPAQGRYNYNYAYGEN